ncbi:MAG: hypothetical protein JWL90_4504 [Chthoniobacteraceae bacterium]|nr:hypothetical protein [Chthoniobacteraceae bacterium]
MILQMSAKLAPGPQWTRLKRCLACIFLATLFGCLAKAADSIPLVVIRGENDSQCAPHGRGNVYAPEILRSANELRMWYGGQGRDGHDRIHLAVSADAVHWRQLGVVVEDRAANHCNDPSVVKANGLFFLFYTRAGTGVTDEIAVATSTDGERWEMRGTALGPGKPDTWDSLSVGRPAVLCADGLFKMWYDGRKDLPPNAPDKNAPKSNSSQRHVGYATATDGLHWERHGSNPVYDHDAGGIHVLPIGDHLAMLSESRLGTEAAVSHDGISWRKIGLLVERAALQSERHGHVTPFLLPDADAGGATLFYGAAAESSWDANSICRQRLSNAQWALLVESKP